MGHRKKNRKNQASPKKQKREADTATRVNTRKESKFTKFLRKLNPFSSCCSGRDRPAQVESSENPEAAGRGRGSVERAARRPSAESTSSLKTDSTMTGSDGSRSAASPRRMTPSPDATKTVNGSRPTLKSPSQPLKSPQPVASNASDNNGRRSTEAEEQEHLSSDDSSSTGGSWESPDKPDSHVKSARSNESAKSTKSAKSAKSGKSLRSIISAKLDTRVHPLCTAPPDERTNESAQEQEQHEESEEDSSPESSRYSMCDRGWTTVEAFSDAEGDEEEDCPRKERCCVFPPIKDGLRGWKLPENIHQFAISPEPPYSFSNFGRVIMSCAINHVILAVHILQLIGQGTTDMFMGYQCTDAMKEMFKYAIRKGNTYHLMKFPRHQCLTARQALSYLKERFLSGLEWNIDDIRALSLEQGIDLPDDFLPEGLELEIVNPETDGTSLAQYILQLDAEKSEGLLYTIDNKFIVFLPTDDGRVLLIDEHPHPRLGAGAIVLIAPDTRDGVQEMLDGYFKESMNTGFNLGQGTKFSYNC